MAWHEFRAVALREPAAERGSAIPSDGVGVDRRVVRNS